ncbi:MAG: LytTR family DNA-binding domain-containing protein [Salibacteraceae bacterium]|jgi:two-component system, LytTR family, response regulator|nr:LytTR family DNA-binding domain-containing protein [Salibacteraceae bacterium]MDP4687594.1 LytTR family DNA-binding domain-containing protein [Salibacteraceae bacterium]MDP4764476.1 LytTR family DNA-binding domain-containing protein [Salibacteraceae bacterium]MDP4843544.1 LytTR family DNA-binding domain-containing protein [Salibacteraceae bacterium]MDP4934632.1 LytTR family DNA-binding domain-containing protein [Salibacteraceae bacterium]
MIRALVIDDERLARQELKNLLQNFEQIQVVGESGNVDEALDLIDKENPDLIFLDIQMPGKNGFELLDEIQGNAPDVVFVTAYDEYALKAFEVNALDYLMKPVDEDRLAELISQIDTKISKKKAQQEAPVIVDDRLDITDQVFLKDGEKCWFVQLEKIRLFESEGNYVRVYFDENRPLILKSLNALTDRLSEKYFFRASRKHILNLRWIEKVETWFNGGLLVILKDGTKVEVSRRQSVKLKEMMAL